MHRSGPVSSPSTAARPLIAVLVVLLLAACQGPPESAALACDEIVVIAARGSGQPPGSGPQIDALVRQLAERAPDRTISVLPLDYPAVPVGRGSEIADSIATGVANLTSLLGEDQGICQDTPIALVGYSQGALVLRQVIEEPAAASVITAAADVVVLLGDPAREGEDPEITHVGDAERGVDGLVSPRPIPGGWPLPVISVCARGDLFCAASLADGLAAFSAAQDGAVQTASVHSTAYLQPGLAAEAATALIEALEAR